MEKARKRKGAAGRDHDVEQAELRKSGSNALGQAAKMTVVVERAKLGRELRDDRCDESGRQRGDERCIDQRVEPAVDGNAELDGWRRRARRSRRD